MEELYGYKQKAETYKSQVDLLLNEQKLLKEQIQVYRKINGQTKKMNEMLKEQIDLLKPSEKNYKDIIFRTRSYVKKHFSMDIQKQLYQILDKK